MKYILPLVVLLFAGFKSGAQQLFVLDVDGKGIEDVFVSVDEKFVGFTDRNGHLSLSGFKGNEINFSHPSYKSVELEWEELVEMNFVLQLEGSLIDLPEIVVGTDRFEETENERLQTVRSINASQIRSLQAQNSADILRENPEVFIQKSQAGGGSPMIRGFSANAVLLVFDGVRMNNTIYRGGNLQNIITTDPMIMQRVDVLLGPGALQFGSDALGGVVHMQTKSPSFSDSSYVRPETLVRYNTANNEQSIHFSTTYGGKKSAGYFSFSHSSFGQLKVGENYQFYGREDEQQGFGTINFERERINGKDSAIAYPDSFLLPNTGYDQYNIFSKHRIRLKKSAMLEASAFFSSSSEIPRNDRLVLMRNGEPRYAKWSYGPQRYGLARLMYSDYAERNIYSRLRILLAGQYVEESRIDRSWNSQNERNRLEKLFMGTLNVDAEKRIGEHRIDFGIQLISNHLNSSAYSENIETGMRSFALSRYPDEENLTAQIGAYASWKKEYDRWLLQAGVRSFYNRLNSSFSEERALGLPFTSLSQVNDGLSFGLGANREIGENGVWRTYFSRAFRSPNIDDIAKVFDSEPGAVVVPNPELEAESSYNIESAYRYYDNDKLHFELCAYYTFLFNAIQRADFSFNGQDSLLYDGQMSNIQANVNRGKAYIYGMACRLRYAINENHQLSGAFNLIYGEELDLNTRLRHVNPHRASLNYQFKAHDKLSVAFNAQYQHSIPLNDLAPSEQGKPHIYSSFGANAWYRLDLRMQIEIKKGMSLYASVNNLLDAHYRPYSWGLSAPGRHIALSLHFRP